MKELTDYNLLSDFGITGMQIGFVMVNNGNTIGVYVPKLMCDIEKVNKPVTKTIRLKSDMIKNSIKSDEDKALSNSGNRDKITFNNEINSCNYIICKPLATRGMSTNNAPKGSRILIEFLDGDPKKAYYYPFMIS